MRRLHCSKNFLWAFLLFLGAVDFGILILTKKDASEQSLLLPKYPTADHQNFDKIEPNGTSFNSAPPLNSDLANPTLDQTNTTDIFLGDMDLASRLNCGRWKCFIPSASNQDVGYLVKRDIKNLAPLTGAWNVAKWIENSFGGRHFYIDAPFKAEPNQEVRAEVNSLAYLRLNE